LARIGFAIGESVVRSLSARHGPQTIAGEPDLASLGMLGLLSDCSNVGLSKLGKDEEADGTGRMRNLFKLQRPEPW
jgi:hypothetical protein